MKNRNFKANGKRYTIIESNATFSKGKWQAMFLDTERNMWVRTEYYASTQAELKEKVKACEKELKRYENEKFCNKKGISTMVSLVVLDDETNDELPF